jgi:hypothetical protein
LYFESGREISNHFSEKTSFLPDFGVHSRRQNLDYFIKKHVERQLEDLISSIDMKSLRFSTVALLGVRNMAAVKTARRGLGFALGRAGKAVAVGGEPCSN